jgi:hypothetical protein
MYVFQLCKISRQIEREKKQKCVQRSFCFLSTVFAQRRGRSALRARETLIYSPFSARHGPGPARQETCLSEAGRWSMLSPQYTNFLFFFFVFGNKLLPSMALAIVVRMLIFLIPSLFELDQSLHDVVVVLHSWAYILFSLESSSAIFICATYLRSGLICYPRDCR